MSGNFAIKGGGGGPLMANAILNFHFDYLTPSLTQTHLGTLFTLVLVGHWTSNFSGYSGFFELFIEVIIFNVYMLVLFIETS